MGPGRFVNACVIKVILIGEHVRLSIRELFCEMSSTTSVGIPKVDSSNCSPTIGKGYTNLLSPPTITLRLSPLWHPFPLLQNCSHVDMASPDVYSYSKSRCPQTGVCGQSCKPINASIRSRVYEWLCRGFFGQVTKGLLGSFEVRVISRTGRQISSFDTSLPRGEH